MKTLLTTTIYILIYLVFLLGCHTIQAPKTVPIRKCEKHGVILEERSGFVRGGYNHYTFGMDYYKMREKYPHYDAGIAVERQSKKTREFSQPRTDWVCPLCQKEGDAMLERGEREAKWKAGLPESSH